MRWHAGAAQERLVRQRAAIELRSMRVRVVALRQGVPQETPFEGDPMTYSLRQVQPLLTKPELELFQASRAGAIKELNPRQLAGLV